MLIEISAEEFLRDPDAMLDQVQFNNAEVVVKEDGKTVAALINPETFERFQRMHERFDDLTGKPYAI